MRPTELDLIDKDIEGFLKRHEEKELLRFVTIGSVDDGKSTLIGRILYDTENVFDDHLAGVTKTNEDGSQTIDLANLTDGLQAEREQGITIDVAYRYFTTEKRKFIIADTPGHIQYTRNMATGASTAHVAIILIDARLGVLQQTRRHAYIANLLGIPHLAVAVNKMDLKDFDQGTFETIRDEITGFANSIGLPHVTCFPVSALDGDNCVSKSERTPWYEGQSILEFLETVPVPAPDHGEAFALPVQYVIRPDLNFRGYAGTLAAGIVKPGDTVKVLPSGKTSTVERIVTQNGDLERAFAPQSIVLTLNDEIDISRGDTLVAENSTVQTTRQLKATMVWMTDQPLRSGEQYLIKQGNRTVSCAVNQIDHRVDMDTLNEVPANELALNEIGQVQLNLNRPLAVANYRENRELGAFIVIDRLSNNTIGAGMVCGADSGEDIDLEELTAISASERSQRFNQEPSVVWITGRHGVGKMPVAHLLERRLFDAGHLPYVIDPSRQNLENIPAKGAGSAADFIAGWFGLGYGRDHDLCLHHATARGSSACPSLHREPAQ